MRQLSIQYLPIAQLRPYPGNPRTHSRRQIQQIAESIKRFGWTNPLLVSDDGEIVAGHGRFEAAKILGEKSVPTAKLSHLSAEERRAYVIADNRLAELAGWDQDILAIELQALSDLNFDVTLTGFSMGEIDIVLDEAAQKNGDTPDPDDAIEEADPNAPVVSRAGDQWLLADKHRIICGDARAVENYESLLGAESVDVVVADPPYTVKIPGHVVGLEEVRHRNSAFASGKPSETESSTNFLSESLWLAKANSRDGAIYFIFADAAHAYELLGVARQTGLQLETTCAWAKTNAGIGSLYRSQVEFVHVFKVGTAPHVNNVERGRNRTTLWSYPSVNAFGKDRTENVNAHPTAKPVALVADAIRDVSNRGAVVLDPFLGSGTTIIAAEKTGRLGRGIEYEPRYVDYAVRRWQKFTGLQATFSETGETFDLVEERRLAALGVGVEKPPAGRSRLSRRQPRARTGTPQAAT